MSFFSKRDLEPLIGHANKWIISCGSVYTCDVVNLFMMIDLFISNFNM